MRSSESRESIAHWRLDDLAGIELRSGNSVTAPYPRHWHEEYQFCFIQTGGGELFYRGIHHNTPATSLFIVHPGEVHSNETKVGCSFRSIYVDPELIRRTVSTINGREEGLPFFPDPMIFDDEVIRPYLSLHASRVDSCTSLERERLILDLVGRLVTRHAQERTELRSPGKEHKAVKTAREYIAAHHDRNISLGDLAALVNLSPFHLNRVFTKEIGMPPHAFQMQVRVATAKRLMLDGLPLASVAATTGFADQSHFIRHFKRLMKITPGKYLK
ncbi:MAG: AraC family transcriptional regulator, partial [Pyrinomonadaceae bacterium]|nr:AraC family transcriptional regulator [Pyrinomonadaceae bacterium]